MRRDPDRLIPRDGPSAEAPVGTVRVAVVGPSAPDGGGIVDHTTELVARLRGDPHAVTWVAWSRQFPGRWPRRGWSHGTSAPAPDERTLDWWRPDSWSRVGRGLAAQADVLVLVVTTALQFPALRTLARTFRAEHAAGGDGPGRVVIIMHNVTPHERYPADRRLVAAVLGLADRVVVHSASQAAAARTLTATPVVHVRLPFHPPAGMPTPDPAAVRARADVRHDRLLMLGFVRPYKGLDVLLEALSRTRTRPHLTVRGEFWQPVRHHRRQVARLGLTDRVDLRPGFAPPSELPDLFADVDALVMPYRSATASQFPQLAAAHGVPVIATTVGDLPDKVRHGVDGLLVPPGDPDTLAAAIDRFYTDRAWPSLRRGVIAPHSQGEWSEYVTLLIGWSVAGGLPNTSVSRMGSDG